jgi:peptidoglycan hydrolase-like protein with peptidoglycan-binding domain
MPSRSALGVLVFMLAALAPFAQAQSAEFSHNLALGARSADVTALQIFLNTHGFVIAQSGSGSSGHETGYFGSLTRLALVRFQASSTLPATGFLGPLTRERINALLAETLNPPIAATTSRAAADPAPWYTLFDENAPKKGWQPGFGGGAPAQQQADPPAPDTTAPSVSLSAPTDGSTLAGTIALAASASDNAHVASVQFALDGSAIGSPLSSSPYAYAWDSSSVADGSHTLVAVARDSAGNIATSSSVTITLENTPPALSFISEAQTLDVTGEIISWSTSQAATSQVVYGTTSGGPYTFASSSASLSNSHSITLPGLSGGVYYFKVVSTNAAGVTATSTEQSFVFLTLS